MRRGAWRRLLLGEWGWLVRDPLDLLRLVFFAGTIAFALLGRSTAVGLTAASVLLLVARIVNLPRLFDFGVIAAMTLIAWGTALGLYGQFYFYDNLVHGITPFFYAPVLYILLVRLEVLTDPEQTTAVRHHAGVFVSTLAIGMAVGAGWEVIEWLSDTLVGTHYVKSVSDTGSDLLEDTLGSLAGAAFLTVWSISGWATRRATDRAAAKSAQYPATATMRLLRRWLARARRWSRALRAARPGAAAVVLAVAGAIAIAFGTLVVARPGHTLHTLVVLFGVFAISHGLSAFALMLLTKKREVKPTLLLHSAVSAGAGLTVLAWPHISSQALLYLVGVVAIAAGLAGVSAASALPLSTRDRSLLGAAAIASVVLGLAMLARPRAGALGLSWVISLQAIALGVTLLVAAYRARRTGRT